MFVERALIFVVERALIVGTRFLLCYACFVLERALILVVVERAIRLFSNARLFFNARFFVEGAFCWTRVYLF